MDKGISRERILSSLSEEQRAIAEIALGPIQVIAGPGSGKTETMVRRTAYMIDCLDIDPSEILITTFTEKAAENLKLRIKNWVSDNRKAENLTIGTIHGVCLQILEEHGIKYGFYKRAARVLDEGSQALFIWSNFEDIGLNTFFAKDDVKEISEIIKIFNQFSERGTDLTEFKKHINPNSSDACIIAAVETYPKYIEVLNKEQALDFATILTRTLELLSLPEARDEIRARFKYVMVDEYQDTNELQDIILRTIAAPLYNIMVIGDDDQSLYRFRGATVTNFLRFDKVVPNVKKLYLSQNRRSTPEIVSIANSMSETIPTQGRFAKNLFTNNPNGNKVKLTRFDTEEDELQEIVNQIRELKRTAAIKSYNEVAILAYSVSGMFPRLRDKLDAAQVPYKVKGDKSLFEQPSIIALMNALSFLTKGPGQIKDFNLIQSPIFQAETPTTLTELIAINHPEEISEVTQINISSRKDKEKLQKLLKMRKEILASKYRKGYADLVDLFFKAITILDTIKTLSDQQDEETLSEIGKFSNFLSSYSDETGDRSYFRFKSYVYGFLRKSTDKAEINEDETITIQTIHQSKGLEYPVVFMPSLVDSRLPGNRADSDIVPFIPGVHEYWSSRNQFENRDTDFQRLLYVAMTRAEKLLYMSYFDRINRNATPSRYITFLLKDDRIEPASPVISLEVPLNSHTRSNKDKLRLSSSHLQYYIFCPNRFKLALKNNIKAPQKGYFAFGSSLHSAIEEASNIIKQFPRKLSLEEIQQIFENNWSPFGFANKSAADAQKAIANQRFINFIQHHGEILQSIKVSEKKFTLEEDNFVLTGKIDAILESSNQSLSVIDFKTGSKARFKEEPENSFVHFQANIYMEAAERLLGINSGTYYLHFLGENQNNESDYKRSLEVTPQSRKDVLNLINETAERINCNDFSPTPDEARCSSCEYKQVCPHSTKRAA